MEDEVAVVEEEEAEVAFDATERRKEQNMSRLAQSRVSRSCGTAW